MKVRLDWGWEGGHLHISGIVWIGDREREREREEGEGREGEEREIEWR